MTKRRRRFTVGCIEMFAVHGGRRRPCIEPDRHHQMHRCLVDPADPESWITWTVRPDGTARFVAEGPGVPPPKVWPRSDRGDKPARIRGAQVAVRRRQFLPGRTELLETQRRDADPMSKAEADEFFDRFLAERRNVL